LGEGPIAIKMIKNHMNHGWNSIFTNGACHASLTEKQSYQSLKSSYIPIIPCTSLWFIIMAVDINCHW
jgi:hypothetical protein